MSQSMPGQVSDTLRSASLNRLASARDGNPEIWARILADPQAETTLPLVWMCSEFVASSCLRRPSLLMELIESGELHNPVTVEALRGALEIITRSATDDAELLRALRLFRGRHMVRIAWRDLAGWADLTGTLSDLSNLAAACIEFAHDHAYSELAARYGTPHGARSGERQTLTVLGMGKLGGRELNYSSDIDLVFLYPEEGVTDGTRSVENAEFFLRLGQRIVALLATNTADGFVYRVDMRLRPFGDSGRLAISYDSFEEYLQQHGRDWERYAYVKARAIVGSEQESLYQNVIRPFVYRRYLDFGVFESLRTMKDLIAREVARRELQDNVKLGPGGIREIEFIVQAFQLIRGGSDRRLQTRELRTALPQLAGQKLLPAAAVAELGDAYVFLRRLENRLQEYNDQQTHQLPEEETHRALLAIAMNCTDWSELRAQIDLHRGAVSKHFANVVFGPVDGSAGPIVAEFNLDASRADWGRYLSALPAESAEACAQQLETLRDSGYCRRLDETGRRRLQALLPRMIAVLAKHDAPDATLARLLRIIEKIGGRTVYLALLHESGVALARLVDLCARSNFLAEQIAAFPLLLDELIDERLLEQVPTRAHFAEELESRMQSARHEDVDLQIEAMRHFQRAAMFRIAVADFSGQLPLMKISDRLTDLAELIVGEALQMAWKQIAERHGQPRCGASVVALRPAYVTVVAYGKFGGIELGYGSDLDLVFLHDSAGEIQMTDGPQPVENSVFFARIG
ncbi:MAG TPA: bifunctional [glutamate--ammonia ligase]-adenylyl-L-tyrosine phosphorylase/[glutamate--ammonia-ligase] adenylyltransferase, partial [Steroidobacteraceae bacterium]|nr:bifunctional [glutamate--ammonia ligase]-adenylyl-L-tyrosine phosphorylase/[glutamate--ammonia-ligase] adenylyltransferase [Steroidobacteraceae bacterium]